MTLERSFLESAVFEAPSQFVVGLKTSKALSDPLTRVRWKRDARMAIYHNDGGRDQVRDESGDNDAGLGALLESAADDPGILEEPENLEALTRVIELKIHDLMLLPPEVSLAAIGVAR